MSSRCRGNDWPNGARARKGWALAMKRWPLPLVLALSMPAVTDAAADPVSASPAIVIQTSVGTARVRQGDAIVISWQALGAPPASAVALWPVKVLTGHIFASIASGLPATGSFTWKIPVFVAAPMTCAPDATGGCVGTMNPGTTYRIIARLYVPGDADVGAYGPGKTFPDYVAVAESAPFIMDPATGN